jgi:hypothetical protein
MYGKFAVSLLSLAFLVSHEMHSISAQARPAGLKKKKTEDVPRADSFIFRLHYRFTFVLLVLPGLMSRP